jgi:peptidoglycan/xylan/chitin deacetylase (PgdA/CDA1 family)
MIRSIGKTCFAFAYSLTDARRFFPRHAGGKAPFIACYHRVVDNFERSAAGTIPSMLISTRMLEHQIDWLAKHFEIMSLDEIGAHLECGRKFEKPAAAITFDDGYGDVYRHAYPLLRRKGIPAAFFVVTGLVDTGRPQVFDHLYLLLRLLQRRGTPLMPTLGRALESAGIDTLELKELHSMPSMAGEPFKVMTALLTMVPRRKLELAITSLENEVALNADLLDEMAPLSWEMIETMHRGGMTIGSHTKSHLLLTTEAVQTAQKELVESKQALESHLGRSVRHFAYPDGRFNAAVVQAVKRAGYAFSYSICHSRDQDYPLLTIPRKVLWERSCVNAFGKFSPAIMNCQAHSVFDLSSQCEHDHLTVREEVMHGTIY